MCLQNIHCYRRLIYRQCIKFNNAIRPYSHIPDDKENYSSTIKSIKFPDYQLLYKFPYITIPRLFNIMKRNQTIVGGASIPVIAWLQIAGLIPGDECVILISFCVTFTVWFHMVCYMCNNFIGSICFKEDTDEVIISYVNYWGTRIDLKTVAKDITPLTKTTGFVANYWPYKILNINAGRLKLKINTQLGEITNAQDFGNIIGRIA